jgi:hypothetical protein
VTTNLGGFDPGSMTMASIFSDPRELLTVTTDAEGRADYELAIPFDLPPGEHHIVVSGDAPDGAERLWVVPVTIGPDGSVLSVTGAGTSSGGSDGQPLPRTGTDAPLPVGALGLALLLVGVLAAQAARRSRLVA